MRGANLICIVAQYFDVYLPTLELVICGTPFIYALVDAEYIYALVENGSLVRLLIPVQIWSRD